MIAYLKGKIQHIEDKFLILNVADVGYQVFITTLTAKQFAKSLHQTIELHIYHYIRENTMTLYGFVSLMDVEIFKTLLGVTGVGPKIALNILSTIETPQLIQSIKNGTVKSIVGIPGVGPKILERIVIDLKNKLNNFSSNTVTIEENVHADVVTALTSLGYKPGFILTALNNIPKDISGTANIVKYILKTSTK